jgi:hypothetical protein
MQTVERLRHQDLKAQQIHNSQVSQASQASQASLLLTPQ